MNRENWWNDMKRGRCEALVEI